MITSGYFVLLFAGVLEYMITSSYFELLFAGIFTINMI